MEVSLIHGEFSRLENFKERASPIQLVCRKGTVWITQPSDGRDLIVHEGDSVQLDSVQGLLIEAIGGPTDLQAVSGRVRA